ncbi:MAG: restriction endonuclease [Chthoniobacterales bacterium]|nr:restriction endonuclease [Chthoniobacterales bacterium]
MSGVGSIPAPGNSHHVIYASLMIPAFQDLMLPIVVMCATRGSESISNREFMATLAEQFSLTDADREERLASGKQSRFENRVYWALVHLRRAGLIESTGRGLNRISDRGHDVLRESPDRIDLKLLSQFPEFRAFRSSKAAEPPEDNNVAEPPSSPQERIDTAFGELNASLITDIRGKLATVDPFRFERIVLDLLVAMGYGGSRDEAAAVTRKTGDEGIDGVINEDRLGLDVIYVQAKKRSTTSIGRPDIQNFVGALAGKKASKGVFITTSAFHDNAREYAAGLHQKVILIDGRRLAELMIEHGIGVAEEHAYHVKKIDSDYFDEA